MLEKDSLITRGEIAENCEISEKTVTRYIKKMKEFKYIGKGKNGHWERLD